MITKPPLRSFVIHDATQELQALRDAYCRGNDGGAKFHVLFDNHPARVAIFGENAEELGEVDRSLPDDGEYLLFDRLIESESLAPRLGQDLLADVLDMSIAENTAILLSFRGWVATPVDAMAGIETQSHVGRRGHIKQPFRLPRRFDVGGHVRMEHQVKAKVIGHATSICDYFGDVLPLLRGEGGASVCGDSTRNPVSFWTGHRPEPETAPSTRRAGHRLFGSARLRCWQRLDRSRPREQKMREVSGYASPVADVTRRVR